MTTPSSPLTPRSSLKPGAALADRVAKSFPPHACVGGFAAFHRNEVTIVAHGDDAVNASVKTKRTRRVALRARGGALLVACTCAAPTLGFIGCKHVWAALLEIDRQGALASLRGERSAVRVGVLPPEETAGAPGAASTRKKPRRGA
jgi:hypothetical protein